MPAVAKETNEPIKIRRRRKKRIRLKPRVLNLKGCLKTPEDWARFQEWAKVNAQPRKLPEPEPIVRTAKPLGYFKKRLKVLSIPTEYCPTPCVIRGVSNAALNYRASKQMKCLAQPRIRLGDFGCQEWSLKKSALLYEASETIIRLARPKLRLDSADCNSSYEISRCALKRITTATDERLAQPKRYKMSECVERKVVTSNCDEQLSPWVEFLALPKWRFLMHLNTEYAEKLKQQFLEEMEVRGKQAYEEQMKRKEEAGEGTAQKTEESKDDKEEEETEEDEEAKKKRKMEREAWRFQEFSCKEYPAKITEAALNYTATDNIAIMAQPKVYEQELCRDFYVIKKSALTAQASPAIEALAKPKHQCDPVQRPPPREKDEFGRPIYPIPVYKRILPKAQPYEQSKCREKIEGEEETKEDDLENARPISRIAFEPTIDPLFDPIAAQKQAKERKRLAEALERAKEEMAAQESAAENEAEKTESEEKVSKEKSAKEKSVEEKSVKEKSVEEESVEEKSVEEESVEEKSVKEKSIKEKGADGGDKKIEKLKTD